MIGPAVGRQEQNLWGAKHK